MAAPRLQPRPAAAPRPLAARGLAMTGYALVAASLFTVWITGLAAFVLAWVRRRDPDPVARSHFRFQLLVADLAGVAVGVGAAMAVSGVALVLGPLFDGGAPGWGDLGGAVGLGLLGLLLFALSFAGTLVGAAYGAMRLAQGREVHLFRRRARG